jgi:vitamin B12 transporter
MNPFIRTCLFAALSILLYSPTIAQEYTDTDPSSDEQQEASVEETEESGKLKEVVVSDTRTETVRENSGRSMTVIDRDEIELWDKRSVHELLRTAPGVRVSQSGGPGKTTSVFLRGANSDQTLVLIDGTRVNSNTTGAFDFSNLSTDNIQRIEILRGPHSTLYGSEAIGGVINIITRQGDKGFNGEAKVEGGSYDTFFGRLSASGGTGPYDFSFSASDRSTDGVSAAASGTEEDGYDNTTFSGKLGRSFLEDGRVELTARYVDDENEIDAFGPSDDTNRLQEREAIYSNLTVTKPMTSWWDQKLKVGYTQDDLEGSDPDNPGSNFQIDSSVQNYLWQSELKPVDWNMITAGYEVEKRSGSIEGTFDESLYIRSLYLQDRVTIGEQLTATAGIRNDDHETFGSETTYQVSSSYRISSTGTRLHGHYGTGFRAPDLNELFFSSSSPFVTFSGNPDLDPEESEGYDVGIEQTIGDDRLIVDVTYFENDIENLIVGTATTFRNVNQAETDGWEVTGDLKIREFWTVSSTYTYTDARDLTADQPLARRPKQKTTIRTTVRPSDRLSGTVSWRQFIERFDTSGNRLDNYKVVDVSLRYRAWDGLTITARLNNLMDEDYQEVSGFTSPGFNGYVGLEYAW